MIHPYADVNWASDLRVVSASHSHMTTQGEFDDAYATGLRCIAPSNYYPSAPWYPLSEHFTGIPADVIGLPNAEHHSFSNATYPGTWHMNSLGSMFTSGDAVGGYNGYWNTFVDEVQATLLHPDGGGVTLNHPKWSYFNWRDMCRVLDYSSIVLGIEVYNDSAVRGDTTPAVRAETSYDDWDAILKTGRRCWGFWSPDHIAQQREDWLGRCVLLVPTASEYECLKAYRDGKFYGAMMGTGLAFNNISLSGSSLTVETNSATSLTFITDKGLAVVSAASTVYSIPTGAIYVRVEAIDATGEQIYSQPITLIERRELERKKRFMLV